MNPLLWRLLLRQRRRPGRRVRGPLPRGLPCRRGWGAGCRCHPIPAPRCARCAAARLQRLPVPLAHIRDDASRDCYVGDPTSSCLLLLRLGPRRERRPDAARPATRFPAPLFPPFCPIRFATRHPPPTPTPPLRREHLRPTSRCVSLEREQALLMGRRRRPAARSSLASVAPEPNRRAVQVLPASSAPLPLFPNPPSC